MRRRIMAIGLALLLALAAGTAEAHANLVRSEPAAGALLQAAPRELVLEFSEELDPSFSRVQLFNSQQQRVNVGQSQVDRASPRVLRLAVSALPKDSYTALWRVRSAVDGHITEGSLPFGVGVAATSTSLIPPPGAPDPATVTPPPLDVATRWLNLLALALAFGGLPFGLLVWRPAIQRAARAGADLRAADQANAATTRRLLLGGAALFVAANALFLLVQAANAASVPLTQVFGAPLAQLLGGRSGQLVIARVLLALLAGALAWRLPPAGLGSTTRWWAGLGLVGLIILTFSLGSHAAATAQGAFVALVLDWLHIAAMVAWLGGLLPLALALATGRRSPAQALPLGVLIPAFSWLSMSCVALLTLTGLYSYLLQVGQLDLLISTTYGRALLIKLGLFGGLLVLGAINLRVLSPRLASPASRLAQAFGRTVSAELALGTLVLLAVAVMTSVAPSLAAWQAHQQLGLAEHIQQGDVGLTLRVAPAQIGDNEWAVDVDDRRPGAASAPAKVLLRFDMQGMEMGKLQADTSTADSLRYTARGSYTAMGGRWHVEVILRRAGFDDVRHLFEIDILRSPAAPAA